MKKRMLSMFLFTVLCLSIVTIAYAATASFSGKLPGNQGDIEISTVRKEKNTTYFSIQISSLGSGTNSVCAWTEGGLGDNYSSPFQQVYISDGYKNISYTRVVNIGQNVTLNLDNPVKTDKEVSFSGKWSPN